MAGITDYIPPFLPTKPKTRLEYNSFPNDLIAGGRQFCMDMQFMEYNAVSMTNFGQTFFGTPYSSANYVPRGGIRLPVPKKLNDVQTVVWEETSLTSQASSVLGTAGALASYGRGGVAGLNLFNTAGNIAGSLSGPAAIGGAFIGGGVRLNPHLFMLFKSPTFKEYTFQWTLNPKNEQESYTVARIIQQIKTAMLPNTNGFFGSVLLGYPKIAIIKLYPDDFFTFKLKPCAILSVNVDYTGAGQPSFFKKTGAPTAIHLSIALKEIQYNTSNNLNA
jgi:hypothetical protein